MTSTSPRDDLPQDPAPKSFMEALAETSFNSFARWYTVTSLILITIARFANLWPDPIDLQSLYAFPTLAGTTATMIEAWRHRSSSRA